MQALKKMYMIVPNQLEQIVTVQLDLASSNIIQLIKLVLVVMHLMPLQI